PLSCSLFPYTTLFRSRLVPVLTLWSAAWELPTGAAQGDLETAPAWTVSRGNSSADDSELVAGTLARWEEETGTDPAFAIRETPRSEEHTSELQSRENL